MARFIDQRVKEAEIGRSINVSVVVGRPVYAIANFVAARQVDLVVIGNSSKPSHQICVWIRDSGNNRKRAL